MMESQNQGELEYGSILPNGEDWRLRKFDAGMGELEYRIFRNEKFFAMFDNRDDADLVMVMMTMSSKSVDAVLDVFFGRLENKTVELPNNQFAVMWADIDCLYGELKDELRQQQER